MTNCPSSTELRLFLDESLEEDRQATLGEHINQCPRCQQAVEDAPAPQASGGREPPVSSRQAAQLAHAPSVGNILHRIKQNGLAILNTTESSESTIDGMTSPTAIFAQSRYEILNRIGAGGMGAVYRARHRHMDRIVAIKIIDPRFLRGPQAAERFQRELKATAKLNHPNIVAAYDADQLNGSHFLAMELIEGLPLSRLMERKKRLTAHEACHYVRQAALGLQHAHEQQMVHRDIKPANLMVTPEGQVKILDFGLARFATAAPDGGLTDEGCVMGTAEYMAPEQALNAGKVDIRADIYSLGCTLYFLIAGRPPFPAGTYLEKILAHREKSPVPLNELADVPEPLRQVIEQMMHKNPAERYQTPAEVATALEPFCGSQPTAIMKVGSQTEIQPAPKPQPRSKKPRRAVLAIAACAAVALAVVLAAPLLLRIQTPTGTISIETDDENVEVLLKKGGKVVEILDRKTDFQATLQVGEYELEINKGTGKLKLQEDRFILTREGKIVKVWREKAPPVAQAKPPVPSTQQTDVKAGPNIDPGADVKLIRSFDCQASTGSGGRFSFGSEAHPIIRL